MIESGFSPKWSPKLTTVYWLFDGRRTVSEVLHRVIGEFGGEPGPTLAYIEFLDRHGYLESVRYR